MRTEIGDVRVEVPRDRNGSFEPVTVPVGQRRLTGLDQMVISLYAKGLTTGDITSHLFDVYDQHVDRSTISRITDGIVEDMLLWQSRPLDSVYPVLLVYGIRIKIRDGTVTNRTVYVVMGINMDGERDILGLWVGPTGGESPKFWLGVLTELKNRGVADVLMLCCDGLKGLPDSARAVWPLVDVQLSFVNMGVARNRFGFHPHRRKRTSADRFMRSERRPVPLAGDGLRTVIRSSASSAETSAGGGLSTRVSQPRWRTTHANLCRNRLGRVLPPARSR